MKKAKQGLAGGTKRTHYRPQRNVGFVDLVKAV
jgi:hypothetical protein